MSNKTCIIYHNPRCSKSREALALLQSKGINPQIIEYLKNPPTLEALKNIQQLLKIPVREMLRKKESEYKALELDDANISDDKVLSAVSQHPILLERPIVVMNTRAIIARPPSLLQTEGFV